ncbi:multicopper oxidase [Hyaloscypha variabilis F]|uniref:laccase n=1 Tax=Hyaloscypha variabilis (strain UAMH 11265 / GT02V1 / F) TaxID=1149755 RepID=A0A2J6QW04_HYAVF|nr:multicopper oxidase [Hyaloscypha variabilis F]
MGNVVTTILGIIGAMTQQQTNGASLWGTLQAPTFPLFLTNNPLPNGFPWGSLTAAGSNPYTQAPNTGVIRSYDFTISRGTIAPDGYQKSVILINGQFPGPAIEANWGDTIQVTVNNQITGPEEGTSMHWHGLLQTGTPWMDGVPAVGQCPIAPGSSFTYQFQASLYGTTWYHSHYSAQYSGGLLGPLIIHGPSNANYDIDLGPVFLTDYYHTEYFQIVEDIMKPLTDGGNPKPASDNNLINGKMNFDCSTVAAGDTTPCTDGAGISKFKFTTGKTHRLRLINAGSEGIQRFSIDGHNLTVTANDFVPIQPYTTKVVTLGIGQRTDVLVTANAGNAQSAWWMRSNISAPCTEANQPNALAAIYYDKAVTTQAPTSTAWNVPDPGTCANDDLSLTVPYYSIAAATPSTTKTMVIDYIINATGSFLWTLDGTSARVNYNNPVLLLAEQGNLTYPEEWNVKNFGTNTTVRVVINNPSPAAHPMHLHGHNMQILSEGAGDWDGSSVGNANNPQRRDVQLVRAGGHFVMQYSLDNPGAWPFHCHIAWHVSGGLYSTFLERPADIAKDSGIPMVIQETCTNWKKYTNADVVDQIDSGV